MNEDLLKKTIRQLNFAYSVNRRAENPLQYHIANLSGFTKTVSNHFSLIFSKKHLFRFSTTILDTQNGMCLHTKNR